MATAALFCRLQDEDYHGRQFAAFEFVAELAFGLLRAKQQQVGGVRGPVVVARQIVLEGDGPLENGKREEWIRWMRWMLKEQVFGVEWS